MGRIAISTSRKKPADHVIDTFSGAIKMAKRINKEATDVYRLRRSKAKGGNDGEIPRSWQKIILQVAKEDGLDITAEDLILGRKLS